MSGQRVCLVNFGGLLQGFVESENECASCYVLQPWLGKITELLGHNADWVINE